MPEVEILTAQRAVTAAGTPEQIKETPENVDNMIIAIEIRANLNNAGNIYLVNQANRATASTTGKIMSPGDREEIDLSEFPDLWLNLAKIWIDADVNGDGISYTAIRVIG